MADDTSYESEIRRQITKRYENRTEFFGNLAAFIVFNVVLWGVLDPQYGWRVLSVLITGGWLLGLVIHLINFIMTEARENAIAKAIERERRYRSDYMPETEMKRKRERLTQITDDGELLEVVEDESNEPQVKRR